MCVSNQCMFFWFFVFFFKQKTAYEMRISDWSSDVCSSDLRRHAAYRGYHRHRQRDQPADQRAVILDQRGLEIHLSLGEHVATFEIGRASCRERVCQYV